MAQKGVLSAPEDVARNHSLVGGNQRRAIVSCEIFVEMNSATRDAGDADLYRAILFLAKDTFAEKQFAAWLRSHTRTSKQNQVQEPRTRYARARTKRSSKAKAKS